MITEQLSTGFVGAKALKVGRPMGRIARAVLLELSLDALTARQVAGRLKITTNAAEYTCSRLHHADLLIVKKRIHVGGSHKRVALYQAASASQPGQ